MAGFGAVVNGGALDIVFDGEVPRSFTGVARTVISGGQFVTVSGTQDCTGSTVATFKPGSIVLDIMHNDFNAVGIALHNAGSNQLLSVATRGAYITMATGIISGGMAVYAQSGTYQGVSPIIGSVVETKAMLLQSGAQCGRALTAAAIGSFLLVNFSF